jgi:UDP-3-O-[3-hydroxymyristoyl] glucosamine N-acyltransferase
MILYLSDFFENANNNDFFEFMGWSNSTKINTLTFCDDESYINEINNNPNITGVIIKPDFKNVFNDKSKKIYINDDPRYVFYTIFNKNAFKNKKEIDTIIHPTASIHPTAYISNVNVIIGENTIIKPNVTILEDVEIGNNCVIQSGTVIGSEGFEFKKTSKGVISVLHDGKVIIKNNVHIGANTCIDKGFSFRDTFIDDNVMIDNLVHVAHCVHIKNGASIIAGTILGGSSEILENSWLSINSSIAPKIIVNKNGFVSMGAVVTKNVIDNEQVTGNFAIPHDKFLKIFKKNLNDISNI